MAITCKMPLAVILAAMAVAPPSRSAGVRCTPDTMREGAATAASPADADLVVDPQARRRIRLQDIRIVTGPCAAEIVEAAQGQFGLADGRVLEKLGPARFGERPRDMSIVGNFEKAAAAPAMAGMKPAQTILLGRHGPSDSRLYLGLWSSPSRSVVGTFVDARGTARAPVALLSSNRRIGSIGYFPAPDTNTGTVFLTQKLSGTLRATALALDTERWWAAAGLPDRASGSPKMPRAS